MNRSTGTVKWYDPQQGHGFISPDETGEDVFVHHSAIHGTGMKPLSPGDRVEYDVADSEHGPAAEGVLRAA